MKEMIQFRQGTTQRPSRAPRLAPQAHTGWGIMGEARMGSTTVALPY